MDRQQLASARLVDLVEGYARRVYPAVLAQQHGAVVCSPLGVWLLLAACLSGAEGPRRTALEDAVGCSREEAIVLLREFMSNPPPALQAAIAIWVSAEDATEKLAAWVRGLPEAVESGYMPTKAEADAWAARHTLGLIKEFPLIVDAATRIVLASALATKVSWEVPFEAVALEEAFGEASPWRGRVRRVLCDRRPGTSAMIASTESAGPVAVHAAIAKEALTVLSVSAAPDVPREAVLEAAHEVALLLRGASRSAATRCSLFDMALGTGHSWSIAEREVPALLAGERIERIEEVRLPAWRIDGQLNLLRAPEFAARPALEVMQALIGPRPEDEFRALQVATAAFSRFGFEAAAITAFGVTSSLQAPPPERGVERTAILRFDHPYAGLALDGRLGVGGSEAGGAAGSASTGVPLFTAWVATPEEAELEPPSS